jgi:hypothetical protein
MPECVGFTLMIAVLGRADGLYQPTVNRLTAAAKLET